LFSSRNHSITAVKTDIQNEKTLKAKAVPLHAMKALGRRGVLLLILGLGAR
jgi:hypothetical protein